MRLIDADVVIGSLNLMVEQLDIRLDGNVGNYTKVHNDLLLKAQIEEIIKGISELPAIEPQKWVSCSERLPEYEEYVLATFADKSTIDTKVLSVRRIETFDGWCWSDFADEYTWEKDEIIAWMPLPEPWKGEEE